MYSVHVVGVGTIGAPLLWLLAQFMEPFGIGTLTFEKKSADPKEYHWLMKFINAGAQLASENDVWQKFVDMGVEPSFRGWEARKQADVIIDCSGNAKQHLKSYDAEKKLKFAIGQGGDHGFGMPLAFGINGHLFDPSKNRIYQVVSCNTHVLAVLIRTLAYFDNGNPNLTHGDFVCVRRSSDMSQRGGVVAGIKSDPHDIDVFGTHHARDAYNLLATLGEQHQMSIGSSACVVPTQYMHVVNFNLQLKRGSNLDTVTEKLEENPRIATTLWDNTATVTNHARSFGYFGRLLDQIVVPLQDLSVEGKRIRGWAYTPQDGNSLLSTLEALLRGLHPNNWEELLALLDDYRFSGI